MSNEKFTPGPWFVDGFNTVAVLSKINDAGYQHICSCDYGYALPDKALALNQANACLIAAAPDMYEALKKIAEGHPFEAADIAKAALAAALDEQSTNESQKL